MGQIAREVNRTARYLFQMKLRIAVRKFSKEVFPRYSSSAKGWVKNVFLDNCVVLNKDSLNE